MARTRDISLLAMKALLGLGFLVVIGLGPPALVVVPFLWCRGRGYSVLESIGGAAVFLVLAPLALWPLIAMGSLVTAWIRRGPRVPGPPPRT